MKTYSEGDQITIYCITFDDTHETITHAWTDDKELAKWYLKFHNSKRMKLILHMKMLVISYPTICMNRLK